MSFDLQQIKLSLISSKSQVTIFSPSGKVLDSCDTLLEVDRNSSIFDQFDFFKSLKDVIPELSVGEEVEYPTIEWDEQTRSLFYVLLKRLGKEAIQWIIIDQTADRVDQQIIQQARNDSAINEEFLEIKKRYLEMEKELLDYKNKELQRVQEFKSRFFAEVSHEMRTPLNSIAGLLSLLQVEQRESKEYLSALKSTSNHLNAIVNDVLDLSKIEAGKLKLDSRPFNLNRLIQEILTGFSVQADQKKIELKSHVDQLLPKALLGDAVRISQVLYNLVGNAIKFTHKGWVRLTAQVIDQKDGECVVSFQISDTGKGISSDQLVKVMEPYEQMDGQNYSRYGGTGLGMGIAKQLVHLMGGNLNITSEENLGTTISFELLFSVSSNEALKEENSTDVNLDNISVLIAEDDVVAITMLNALAEKWSLKADFVKRVDKMESALGNKLYDAIVTDINLEDGSAINTIKSIHIGDGLNVNTPVILLSGDASSYDMLRKLSENLHFLLKPIDPVALGDILQEVADYKVDLTNLSLSANGDAVLMKELIATIAIALPQEIDRLRQSVEDKDIQLAAKVLHKIKPSISYLGVQSLIDQRTALYDAVQEGKEMTSEIISFTNTIPLALRSLEAYKASI